MATNNVRNLAAQFNQQNSLSQNEACDQVIINALKDGYVDRREIQQINEACRTSEELNVFNQIFKRVHDGNLTRNDINALSNIPGASAAMGSLLKSTLNMLNRIREKVQADSKLSIGDYIDLQREMEIEERANPNKHLAVKDVLGRLILSALQRRVHGFVRTDQYGGKKRSKKGSKSHKGGKRHSKKTSKKTSKKGSKSHKGGKRHSKKSSKKGSKKH